MIWILATHGAATKLRSSPFTETAIAGAHGVVYRPGVEPVPQSGESAAEGPLGTFARGLHRISGFVLSHDGLVAETLLGVSAPIDLLIRYRAGGAKRRRTLSDVVFVGDATVTFPALNEGVSPLVAVPFRVQIPLGDTVTSHVTDVEEA